jgi:glycosyltransferase involved in cell wall biosynthesis
MDLDNKKVAIVHDYLIDFGGAERVLLALHEIYPNAPIYVSILRKRNLGKFAKNFKDAEIIQSWFGEIPFADKLISPLRFLIPAIWESFDLTKYDLVVSSASWAITKGFKKGKNAVEICYCHTPPRYLYGFDTSRRFSGFFGKVVKIYALFVNGFMRRYDYKRAQKVDYFIANSQEVKKRIEKFYGKKADVVYPPVEIVKVGGERSKKNYFLAGGRLTAAKNFDLIIKAFNRLELPLFIYGRGPLGNYLRSIAKGNIRFLGEVTDKEVGRLYARARGYIVAQKDEDFGITPVEAMGQGTPVIAYRGGGYLESVVEGKTGIFFDKLDEESLINAIKKFEKMKFDPEVCVSQAKKFSKEHFKREIVSLITKYA